MTQNLITLAPYEVFKTYCALSLSWIPHTYDTVSAARTRLNRYFRF